MTTDRPDPAPVDEIVLRPAVAADAEPLARLGRESFCGAFAHLYREEDLEQFLAQTYSQANIAREIDDDAFIHCLALGNDRLLGYCKLSQPSPYAEHSQAINPIALNQLYTQPDLTGMGVGAALMEWSIAEARARGCDSIQLSVWSENHRAHRFYRRYGFDKIADIEFWVGSQRDDEFLFELSLA